MCLTFQFYNVEIKVCGGIVHCLTRCVPNINFNGHQCGNFTFMMARDVHLYKICPRAVS